MDQLTKKERRELAREAEKERKAKEKKTKTIQKWSIIGVTALAVFAGGWLMVKAFDKPLPGKPLDDQGRQHVKSAEWEKFKYNSNPPTSGPHDSEWTKAGVYDEPQGVGHLVHSLEHGYIIISYNCQQKVSKGDFSQTFSLITNYQLPITSVYAHDDQGDLDRDSATASSKLQTTPATVSAELSADVWKSKECTDLKKQLKDFAESQRLWKLIVVPWPQLDTRLALTAWTRIDTFSSFDKDRMVKFIEAFRDQGPEKTME